MHIPSTGPGTAAAGGQVMELGEPLLRAAHMSREEGAVPQSRFLKEAGGRRHLKSYGLSSGLCPPQNTHLQCPSASLCLPHALCTGLHISFSISPFLAASQPQPGPAASRWPPSSPARGAHPSPSLCVSGRQVRGEGCGEQAQLPANTKPAQHENSANYSCVPRDNH